MVKYKVVVALLVTTLAAFLNASTLDEDWGNLRPNERWTVYQSYLTGKPYGLGLTMAAIAWKESNGGRWLISADGNDYGLYHINIYWFLKSQNIADNTYNRLEWGTRLIVNGGMGEAYVISKLTTLVNRYNGDYMKVWKAYNGSGEAADRYASDIRNRVRVLRKSFTPK